MFSTLDVGLVTGGMGETILANPVRTMPHFSEPRSLVRISVHLTLAQPLGRNAHKTAHSSRRLQMGGVRDSGRLLVAQPFRPGIETHKPSSPL